MGCFSLQKKLEARFGDKLEVQRTHQQQENLKVCRSKPILIYLSILSTIYYSINFQTNGDNNRTG